MTSSPAPGRLVLLVDRLQLGARLEGAVLGRGAGPRDALRPGCARRAARPPAGRPACGALAACTPRASGRRRAGSPRCASTSSLKARSASSRSTTGYRRPRVGASVVSSRPSATHAPAAVEQAHVSCPNRREDPQGVGGPPVVLVAVDHDRVVAADALARRSSAAKPLAVDVVAGDGVVQLGVPVDLDRARDVPGLVEQHVFVGLDDDEARVARGARPARRW